MLLFFFCWINAWKTLGVTEYLALKSYLAVPPTDSYGSKALLVPDVDYLGDHHHMGCTPRKQEEEPLASLCQVAMYNSTILMNDFLSVSKSTKL